eukprot:577847-Rhodomonas_salina.1
MLPKMAENPMPAPPCLASAHATHRPTPETPHPTPPSHLPQITDTRKHVGTHANTHTEEAGRTEEEV